MQGSVYGNTGTIQILGTLPFMSSVDNPPTIVICGIIAYSLLTITLNINLTKASRIHIHKCIHIGSEFKMLLVNKGNRIAQMVQHWAMGWMVSGLYPGRG
jgi:hypothetical protein